MKGSKIALFGGSFNPVSRAHLQITSYFLRGDYQKVLLIPCAFRRDKIGFASNEHRIKMLKIAAKEYFGEEPPLVDSFHRPEEIFMKQKLLIDETELK